MQVQILNRVRLDAAMAAEAFDPVANIGLGLLAT
jgi:hypothetical protein